MLVVQSITANIAIEDCPFCGATEAGSLLEINEVYRGAYTVCCKTCTARGPEKLTAYDAATEWNFRV